MKIIDFDTDTGELVAIAERLAKRVAENSKEVPGWPSYCAHKNGSIESLKHTGVIFLKPGTSGSPYPYVFLCDKGKRKKFYVHQLVMLTFVGPRPAGMEIRHLDGDPTNNCLENLEYGTHSQNNYDIVEHGNHYWANKTHCRRGHEYTPENTYVSPSRPTARYCRKCMRINVENWQARQANQAK